ncbi:MAG: hypothetical protein JO295_03605 [Verrucomicrobia bacterium]|nr:hypothetical protein [Verrucomicrobiota bacterium]
MARDLVRYVCLVRLSDGSEWLTAGHFPEPPDFAFLVSDWATNPSLWRRFRQPGGALVVN